MAYSLRWKVSLWLWWLFMKVTPRCRLKDDMLAAMIAVAKSHIATTSPRGE